MNQPCRPRTYVRLRVVFLSPRLSEDDALVGTGCLSTFDLVIRCLFLS